MTVDDQPWENFSFLHQMRVKLVTNPPLPSLKAWFSFELSPTQSISDLKNQLCADVQLLRGLKLKGHDIKLVLDEFQLLDEGPIHVLREGDLIYVENAVPGSAKVDKPAVVSTTSKKRKRAESLSRPSKPAVAKVVSDSESSSSEESSSSSSSDSSSSESSSDSDSSASESDSESDAAPAVVSSRLVKNKLSTKLYVPPGQGKPTTRSRNVRRRRKQKYDQMAIDDSEIPPDRAAGVNAIPIGAAHVETAIIAESQHTNGTTEIAMASLSNKNKRRGFKGSMGQNVPEKIVFAAAAADETPPVRVLPRLIPPSERQNLPSNMLVTSVDVEEGLYPKKQRRKRDDIEEVPLEIESGTKDESGVDVNAIGREWDALVQIKEQVSLSPGTLVGWKALGINPVTITPEVLLHVAMVQRCEGESVITQPLTPVLNEEEPGEEEYTWTDIISGDWRIISIGSS